jgi:hypothetical protein
VLQVRHVVHEVRCMCVMVPALQGANRCLGKRRRTGDASTMGLQGREGEGETVHLIFGCQETLRSNVEMVFCSTDSIAVRDAPLEPNVAVRLRCFGLEWTGPDLGCWWWGKSVAGTPRRVPRAMVVELRVQCA